MAQKTPYCLLICLWLLSPMSALADQTVGPTADEQLAAKFAVPEGFRVSLVAGPELANNIYSMTIDARGNIVVAGPGYVKVLHDDDRDGRADRATLYNHLPKSGSQGMYFDDSALLLNGDRALRRWTDRDGDSKADGKPAVWMKLAHPEHGAHGVVRGPDGWFYVITGNDAGVRREAINRETSPVADPRCGVVLRISPDGQQREVLAHGFRNPYRLAFDRWGRLFTVDADGERAFHLPWYSPSRLYDIAIGQHHGWVQEGWQHNWARPGYFPDNVPRLVEIGRGSPTGLVCYRHHAFPERYRGGLFSACWTLGRVYFLPLQAKGASYASGAEIFLQPTGDAGFAPVDLAVAPDGDLLVAIGGRGTRGSVFRIHHESGGRLTEPIDPLDRVLTAPQPLSSWSRRQWTALAKRLGANAFARAWRDSRRSLEQRVRAVEILVELFGGVRAESLPDEWTALPPPLAARLVWALAGSHADDPATWRAVCRATYELPRRKALSVGRFPSSVASASVAEATAHGSDTTRTSVTATSATARSAESEEKQETHEEREATPELALCRTAWECLLEMPPSLRERLAAGNTMRPQRQKKLRLGTWPNFIGALTSNDRRLRWAAITVARRWGLQNVDWDDYDSDAAGRPLTATQKMRLRLATLWVACVSNAEKGEETVRQGPRGDVFEICRATLTTTDDVALRLEALRLIQIGLGGIGPFDKDEQRPGGYWARLVDAVDVATRRQTAQCIASLFPTGNDAIDRELARTAALLEVEAAGLLEKLAARWSDESSPVDDVHELIVASRLPGPRSHEVTRRTADCLCRLQEKIRQRQWSPSRNWPLHVGRAFSRLLQRDASLATAMLNSPYFGHPDHSLFVARMPKTLRREAAQRLLEKVQELENQLADGEAGEDQQGLSNIWTAELFNALAGLPDNVLFPLVRSHWDDPVLRDTLVVLLARAPREEDRARFLQSLDSADETAVARAAGALAALKAGSPSETAAALSALRRWCSVTANVRVGREARRALVQLLETWSGRSIAGVSEPKSAARLLREVYEPWHDWFVSAHPEHARRFETNSSPKWSQWQARLRQIDFRRGDPKRGKLVFEKQSCHRCHRDAGRLGPELPAAVRRFSREDLFAAIVLPSRDVSPAYRAVTVVTTDGHVYQGLPIYASPEGTLLQTGPATTVRITAEDRAQMFPNDRSLMPEGLLDNLSDQAIADLYAYLQTLAHSR